MKVAIVMGSKSDYPVVERAEKILSDFGVEFESRIISAHRTPAVAEKFATSAVSIGIPIQSSTLDGLDSLLSTVQMPKGIPVATVAIDGAENAALLAVQILSLKYPELQLKIIQYKEKMAQEIIVIDNEFQKEKKR